MAPPVGDHDRLGDSDVVDLDVEVYLLWAKRIGAVARSVVMTALDRNAHIAREGYPVVGSKGRPDIKKRGPELRDRFDVLSIEDDLSDSSCHQRRIG